MPLLEGVHKQAGQPDTVVPLKVDAEGQLAGSGDVIFQPSDETVSLAVSTTSARVALPAGSVFRLSNGGSTAIAVRFGDSAVVATLAHMEILPSTSERFRPMPGVTHLAGIVASGTGTLKVTGGSGA